MLPDTGHSDGLPVAREIAQDPRFPQWRRQSNGTFRKRLPQVEHDLGRARLSLKEKDAASSFEMFFDRDRLGHGMRLRRLGASDEQTCGANYQETTLEIQHRGPGGEVQEDRSAGKLIFCAR
jgi:hypothetical protein